MNTIDPNPTDQNQDLLLTSSQAKKRPMTLEEFLKQPNVILDQQPINTATQITGYPRSPKKPKKLGDD